MQCLLCPVSIATAHQARSFLQIFDDNRLGLERPIYTMEAFSMMKDGI